jgi:hypothetical protein
MDRAQALFRYLGIVEQIELRDLGTDRGQEDDPPRPSGVNGGFDRRDCFMRSRKAGLGVEVGRCHEKHAVDTRERLRQTVGIGDRSDRDLAALLGPRPALLGGADNGPDRQAGVKQSTCDDAPNPASDSRHGVHGNSLIDHLSLA